MAFSVGVKITLPKKLFKDFGKNVESSVERALKDTSGPAMIKLFEQSVQGWQHKPEFHSEISVSSRNIILRVFPFGRGKSQYNLVSQGSPSHIIESKSGGGLRFRHGGGYVASTKPGSLMSGPRKSTGRFVRKQVVSHPGFAPRNFDVLVADEYDRVFHDDMQNAFNQAAKEF